MIDIKGRLARAVRYVAAGCMVAMLPAAPAAADPGNCAFQAYQLCQDGWEFLGYQSEQECRQVEAAYCEDPSNPPPPPPEECIPGVHEVC